MDNTTKNNRLFVLPPPFFNIFLALFVLCFSFTLSFAQSPTAWLSGTTYIGGYHIKCNGQSTGTINNNPTFGAAPYTFLWNTGDTTAQLKNKPAGTYIVTVTDANNNTQVDTFKLRQPLVLSYESTVSNFRGYNLAKNGDNNGFIHLAATGGTPPYQYLWNNGDSLANAKDLTAGSYSFTITDANQCSTNGSITLTQPSPVQLTFTNITNPTCFKGNDGSAQLNLSGGLGNFTVSWDNGSFETNPTDLKGGYNAVRIYEHGTAIIDTGITLTSPSELVSDVVLSQFNNFNVSCVDCFNGSITTTITGGTAPYTYSWKDDPLLNTANRSNLNGGDFDLTITDANGCEQRENITLTMPNPQDWSRYGNANIDTTEFIGSTDTSAVVFKSNNTEALRLAGNGKVVLPAYAGAELLAVEVNGNLKKIDDIKNESTKPSSKDCYNFSPAPGFEPTPTWTAEPGKMYTCPNVGIGNINPQHALDISGGLNTNYIYMQSLPGISAQTFANNQLKMIVHADKLGIGTSPSERLHVDGNAIFTGKIGIGGTTPATALHIKDAVDNSILIENTIAPNKFKIEGAAGYGRIISDGSIVMFFNSESQDVTSNFSINKNASSFSGSNIELFKMNNNGNSYFKESLSIGTSAFNADFKLQVCGGIKAKRIRVEEGWCDYVFEDNYKLLSLIETETYYKKNKHLPEIPSTSEIETEGLDLGKLVALQMKKIEELTIHLVEMQKQIEKLKVASVKK